MGTEQAADLVYAPSKWQRHLFGARANAPVVAQAAAKVRDALRAGMAGDGDVTSEAMRRATSETGAFAGETFARLYDDPAKLEASGSAWATKANGILDGLPEWANLRREVEGDPDMSAIAAGTVLDGVAPKLQQLVEEAEAEEAGTAKPGTPGLPSAEDRARAALRKAVAAASKDVADTKEAMAGLAPGMERAPLAHEQADTSRLQVATLLRSNPGFREVLRRAGRIHRLASDRRKVRTENAKSEVVDLERGGDLARILPSQLARLRHPKLRVLALRDIVERQALQYRLQGKEPLGRGPIVVLLDESGSMHGEPAMWAHAVGIALVLQGSHEKRTVTVAGFNAHVTWAMRVEKGIAYTWTGPSRAAGWVQSGTTKDATLTLLSRGVSGGTEFDAPLNWSLDHGGCEDRADIVFVTDGQDRVGAATLARVAEAKTKGLRLFDLCVNAGAAAPGMAELCDEVCEIDKQPDIGKAIAGVMP